MIEITFNTNAWVGLREAQTYGSGPYKEQGAAVMIYGTKGDKATEDEIHAARKAFNEEQRRRWEAATPMGGDKKDVFQFMLMLGSGYIVGDVTGDEREAELKSVFGEACDSRMVKLNLQEAAENMGLLTPRIAAGEPVRVWYSDLEDDYCGLLWFADQLCSRDLPHDKIFLVKVPEWGASFEGNYHFRQGTAEVTDMEWHTYVQFQHQAPEKLIEFFAGHWKQLQAKNSRHRAVINGQPSSVPDDFYDGMIWQTIDSMGDELRSIRIMGELFKRGIKISDNWLLSRLEAFAEEGKLTKAGQDPDLPHHFIFKK